LCEGNADLAFGKCWKRLAGGLGKLAPHAIETAGHQALKFHIPDGKYRQQVFALEDHCDGWVRVYLPDVTAAAAERKILKQVSGADGSMFTVDGGEGTIQLELISSETKEMPAFCKPMLGWGRRALKTSVSTAASEEQMRVVERLCELAAESWAGRELPVAPIAPAGPVGR
jgi:hypothetical protein